MRVSTSQFFSTSVNAMLDNQSSLSKTQLQLATGRKILTPADDPTGSDQILNLTQLVDSTTQYQRNADMAKSRQQLEESTLGSAGDLLQRVRELVVQANNDSQTPDTRKAIAQELRQLRSQLIQLANTHDTNGDFLFAGFNGKIQPFAETASGQVQYSGDQGTRYLQIGPTQMIADSDPGSAVFQGARNGNGTFVTSANVANTGTGVLNPGTVANPAAVLAHNYQINFTSATTFDVVDTTTATTVLAAQTYVDGGAIAFNGIQVSISGAPATGDSFAIAPSSHQDVFATVQNIINGLETYSNDPAGVAQLHNTMNQGFVNLDQAMEGIFDFRARAGARLNAIDSQKGSNDSLVLDAQQALSQVQDLDYAGAISRLNQQMLALQAAQQTFTKVQGLSLFNFLR